MNEMTSEMFDTFRTLKMPVAFHMPKTGLVHNEKEDNFKVYIDRKRAGHVEHRYGEGYIWIDEEGCREYGEEAFLTIEEMEAHIETTAMKMQATWNAIARK